MGYYTDFNLSDNSDEVIRKVEEVSGYEVNSDGQLYGVKWYDWHDHMINVSQHFPDQIIYLEGVGEDVGDVWKARFRNGKSEVITGKLVFGDFNIIT